MDNETSKFSLQSEETNQSEDMAKLNNSEISIEENVTEQYSNDNIDHFGCSDQELREDENALEDRTEIIAADLRDWALAYGINHSALNALLAIQRRNGYPWLPKDSRTLLNTARKITIAPIPFIANKLLPSSASVGKFWYNGLENSIRNAITPIVTSNINLKISVNIDGLPVYNSSSIEFWPILVLLNDFNNIRPLVVAIAAGTGKPDVNILFRKFVEELKMMWSKGIEINGHNIKVVTTNFICDSPARALAKGKS